MFGVFLKTTTGWGKFAPHKSKIISGTPKLFELPLPRPGTGKGITEMCQKIRIACKSDPTELPKSWFLVNNITEKFEKLLAWFGVFFSILNDLNCLEGSRGRQPGGRECQFGCEGHHRREKVLKGHRRRQPLKSTLTRSDDWPNNRTFKMVKLVANFQWCYWPKINFLVALPGQIYRLVV